jgi:hypothetical protein
MFYLTICIFVRQRLQATGTDNPKQNAGLASSAHGTKIPIVR